ncbi:TPR end-of-group domain-containing protein [Pyxidicoccus caerfyrddinensis]|uniref:TPR end-of-group domain-containing protein n=1 Tax=Pyxidicoccus caerfyrddinensis TaxID=2709663 RepID=UPI003B837724
MDHGPHGSDKSRTQIQAYRNEPIGEEFNTRAGVAGVEGLRRGHALEYLGKAIDAGLKGSWAQGDPDLEHVRKDPRFQKLAARLWVVASASRPVVSSQGTATRVTETEATRQAPEMMAETPSRSGEWDLGHRACNSVLSQHDPHSNPRKNP